jgi:hypothetical protein
MSKDTGFNTQDTIIKKYTLLSKKIGAYPSKAMLKAIGISRDSVRHHFGNITNLKKKAIEKYPDIFKTIQEPESKREELIKIYCQIIQEGNKLPSHKELSIFGITRNMIDHNFGNIDSLRKEAKHAFPKLFAGCIEEDEYNSFLYKKFLRNKISEHGRLVITSAVNGHDLDEDFYASLKLYCEKNNALLLIIPCEDKTVIKNQHSKGWFFDPALEKELFVFGETPINKNILISSIRVNVNQVDPHTGIGRLTHNQGSFIFGSPKQNLQYFPTSNKDFPRASMSTGVITKPKYSVSNRRQYLSKSDHVMGAIVVEVENNSIYHFRQIQADGNGAFAYLGKLYDGKEILNYPPKAFVLGDLHAGHHDESALKCWLEVAKETGVKELILHDVFDGSSISHWTENDLIIRTLNAEKRKDSLEDELKITAEILNRFTKLGFDLVLVASNHDEFLHRYLRGNRFRHDYINYRVASDLAGAFLQGEDPLEYGLKKYGGLKGNVKFLTRDDDYLIKDIQLAAHGDVGANGKRNPSKAGIETAYGSAVVGHSHTPGILRGVWQVGTTSLLKLEYNKGSSSWAHSSCLVYPNGQRQLINSINGKYKI